MDAFFQSVTDIINYLRELNLASILFRIVLAIVLAGLIGVEREEHNRAAGFRTHVLVCLGSVLVMLTSQYMNGYFTASTADPARLGAQVISGIGFLGAGTIIVTGAQIKGLTTAAGLWAVACMGIAIGIGFYEGAIIGGLTIYFSLVMLSKLSHVIRRYGNNMSIYVEIDDYALLQDVTQFLTMNDCRIDNIKFKDPAIVNQDAKGIIFNLHVSRGFRHDIMLEKLNNLQCIIFCDEISG